MKHQVFQQPTPTPWATTIVEAFYFDDWDERDKFRAENVPHWQHNGTYNDYQGGVLANFYIRADGTEVMIPTSYDGGCFMHVLNTTK